MCSEKHFFSKRIDKKLDNAIQRMIQRNGVDRKTADEVFDKSTLFNIEKLISDRIIDYVDYPISTGKEGNVFCAITPTGEAVALKIYRISTATFKHMSQYILGDPRFQSIHKSKRDIVFAWTAKEYKNLELLHKYQIPCPIPIKMINNVLVMEFIGKDRQPAPLLKDVKVPNPEKLFDQIISYMHEMFSKANLIHSDLSAFNILYHQHMPIIIDLGQAVLKDHPQSVSFLYRDIETIQKFFKRYKIDMPSKEILFQQIIKKK